MSGERLLTVAGAVARSWAVRYGLDYDELRAVIALALVEAEPDDVRHAFDIADWTAEAWCYAERSRRAARAS